MYKKTAVHTRFILIMTLKLIHCCKSRFSFRDKGPLNNIPSSNFSPKKQQRCNLDRYSFVYVSSLQGELLFVSVMEQITLKNSVLVVKKQHDFVAGNVPNRMRSSKKKKVKELNSGAPSRRRVTHAVTHLSSDEIACNLAIFFAQINLFFFLLQQFSYMFACFVGNCLYLYD